MRVIVSAGSGCILVNAGAVPNAEQKATMNRTLGPDPSRRAFLKTVSYVAPTILTLQARPAFAQRGSGGLIEERAKPNGNNGGGNGEDPQPAGNPPINDGPGGRDNPGIQGGNSGNSNPAGNSNAGNSNAGGGSNSNAGSGSSSGGGNNPGAKRGPTDTNYAKPK